MKETLDIQAHNAAFGDAAHPSTRLMLEALAALANILQQTGEVPPARICDMGCGSGILSLRAAQLWPEARIIAADILRESIETTRANAHRNGATILAVHSDGFHHPDIKAAAPYDLIVMNILAEPIMRLLHDAHGMLAAGGAMLLSGMLVWQQEPIINASQLLGLELAQKITLSDWVVHLWVRPEAI